MSHYVVQILCSVDINLYVDGVILIPMISFDGFIISAQYTSSAIFTSFEMLLVQCKALLVLSLTLITNSKSFKVKAKKLKVCLYYIYSPVIALYF